LTAAQSSSASTAVGRVTAPSIAGQTSTVPSATVVAPPTSLSTDASRPAVPTSAVASVLTASAPIEAAITTAASSSASRRASTTISNAAPAERPIPTFADGIHIVGDDVQPGRYILEQADVGCYWARLRDASGGLASIIANDNALGQVVVDILATDAAFESVGCGTWIAYLGAYPTASFADGKWVVPTQVAPGRWQAPGGSGCYWARLRDFADTVDSVIASEVKRGLVVVDIEPGDEGFESKRCGTWTPVG
jgi:hypothetical protein